MHQPIDGDPNPSNSNRNRRSPLHRAAADSNVDLTSVWLSGRPDDYNCQKVSLTYEWTQAYRTHIATAQMPGVFRN